MQPLKRYTQCGSLTMLFGVFIVLFGVSSTALTTFGKTSSNVPPATPEPIVKGRECTGNEDCVSIDRSSCVKDLNDYKLRCLCGDDSAPQNGLCPNVPKGLRHKCSSTNDCEPNMICTMESANKTTGVAKFMSPKFKLCLCDNESGYVENVAESICSGGVLQAISNILISVASVSISIYSSLRFYEYF